MLHAEDPFLHVEVERGLPREIAVGKGNASFVSGWCFHRHRRIVRLELRVNGGPQRVWSHSMPRADVLRRHDREADPARHSFRSGFWGVISFPRTRPSPAVVEVVARLSNGHVSTRTLGEVELAPGAPVEPAPAPSSAGDSKEPLIAVCMATYDPPLELFHHQVESLRAQTHRNWMCVISDDDSRPDLRAAIEGALEGDPRFHVSGGDRRLGYYGNFERALSLVPPEAEFVALCDQDDRWYPEKLAKLRAAIEPGVSLAYSDMRIVDDRGRESSPTYWTARRRNDTNLMSLLVANTVTAAAMLFPRRLLDDALPFPPRVGHAFHDHWLALAALATGRIAYVDEPLYDYVQHSGNAYGVSGARWPARRLRRPAVSRTGVSVALQEWRSDYFLYACSMQLQAGILLLRAGERLKGRRRRAARFVRASQRRLVGIALCIWLWLRARGARLRRAATMGMERHPSRGLLWRQLVVPMARLRRGPPEYYAQGRAAPAPPSITAEPADSTPLEEPPPAVRQITQKIAPLPIEVREDVPRRLNMLVPTIDLDHFFGAYIGKFNLLRRLAEEGERVRLVAVDPTILPDDWRERVSGYAGLESLLDKIEVEFAPTREQLRLVTNPEDRFIATTSWTAHLAHRASKELGHERFIFVIQEYDALTYPSGTLGAVVREAYSFPHFAVFSTEMLREYFRRHQIGVYANGNSGDRASIAFENAITPIPPPTTETLTRAPRLLFYARPERHAERNMFELGLMALAEAIGSGCFHDRWEFHGIGAQREGRVKLADGAALRLMPRRPQDQYAAFLSEYSVGLSLMDTPHPSLVPMEMASAGMLVVTSTFENKTAEALTTISGNLIPVEPTVSAIAEGLYRAVGRVDDVAARIGGANVNWSRSWETSFEDELVRKVLAFAEQT